eukprot:3631358-Rhodomonas_salina.1
MVVPALRVEAVAGAPEQSPGCPHQYAQGPYPPTLSSYCMLLSQSPPMSGTEIAYAILAARTNVL